ncbi:MAG: septum formation initiator family protein [Bacteroidales bacterium]|nr:septum formation initiator family protein [Bacteroidales bacterium]
MWKKIARILKNKYFIAVLAFVIWMLFFDRNSMMYRYKQNLTLNKHQQEREFYLSEIEKDSIALHELSSDTQNLIRFAREKYLMKKDDEDIYLIIEE